MFAFCPKINTGYGVTYILILCSFTADTIVPSDVEGSNSFHGVDHFILVNKMIEIITVSTFLFQRTSD